MNIISDEQLINRFSKSVYEDALFEYEVVKFKNFDVKQKDNGAVVVKVDVAEGKRFFKVLLNIKNDIVGFCDCSTTDCKHQLFAVLKYNEYVLKTQSSIKQRDSDIYKYDLLKKIYTSTQAEDLIFLKVRLGKINDNKIRIGLKAGIVGEGEYVVSDMARFLNNVYENKELVFSKTLKTSNYGLELNSREIFERLRVLSIKLTAQSHMIEKQDIDINELNDLFSVLINNEVLYDNISYIVRDRLDDITLKVVSIGDGFEAHLEKSSNYLKLNDRIVVNHINHYFYILDERQIVKIDLIDSFVNTEKKIIIDKAHKDEFITEMLPKLYNEFNTIVDFDSSLQIIEQRLQTSLYCHLDNRIIHIKPKFMYGDYDAFANNNGVLIRRNNSGEEHIINLLLENGFVYDYIQQEFVIEAERKQYLFLTKNLFDLRQEIDIFLDDKLKNAIKTLTNNNISIGINSESDGNYFELDIELEGISVSDIPEILKSFKAKKEYVRLEDGTFIALNDLSVLEQLEFIDDVAKETLNTYHIPKYRAIYLKNYIDGLFNNHSYNDEFNDYISELQSIKDIDFEKFHLHNVNLREYQKNGINFIQNLYEAKLGCLLADEMGLGKTIQTISFLKYNNINNALIIVPKALLFNWQQEFEKFAPELDVELIYEQPTKRIRQINESLGSKIILSSYNMIVNDLEHYEDFTFDTIIIDEAQYIKNPAGKTSQNIKKIKANFYLALTGTPIENSIIELWSIFDFIIPGYLGDLASFKKRFVKSKRTLLTQIIAPFVIRRLKKDVLEELPAKIERNILCDMEDVQKQLYVKYTKEAQSEVTEYLNVKNIGQKHMQILGAITRLRQLALDPKLFVDDYRNTPGKIEVFNELIDEIINSKQKVVVFSQFTKMLNILKTELENKEIKYYYLDGETRPKQRMMDVEKFNKNNIPVYLISLKAGGVGLNLTSANNVIIYDPWWNPAVENQAIDRTHRIGQKKAVNVYRLISNLSIEQKIADIKDNKLTLLSETLENSETVLSKMSTEQLVDLFYIDDLEES